jgi:hypothetical protein
MEPFKPLLKLVKMEASREHLKSRSGALVYVAAKSLKVMAELLLRSAKAQKFRSKEAQKHSLVKGCVNSRDHAPKQAV